jgi:predicted transcriptional regulator of viral defense system
MQTRAHGPRTQLRITTREQTLLDSLYKPHHCGGPAVVFEAWETALGAGGLDEERLAEYLRKMDYPATARRTGAMLQVLGYVPGTDLSRVLEEQREAIDPDSPFARISLLPGVPYANLNERWLVNIP